MAAEFVFNPQQRFACRDCPAKCCRNWSITASAREVAALLAIPWARERLTRAGASFARRSQLDLAAYRFPMVEKNGQFQCAFLDDDNLCSIHKREGHEKLPALCQSYPFAFVIDRRGVARVSLSRYCPSIRDNYGEPLAGQLEAKFQQTQGFHVRLPESIPLGAYLIDQDDYLQLADLWLHTLETTEVPAHAIGAAADHLLLLLDALGPAPSNPPPPGPTPLPPGWLDQARTLLPDLARQKALTLRQHRPDQVPFTARMLAGLLILPLADPTFKAIASRRPYHHLPGIARNVLCFLTGRGDLRLEGCSRPVTLNSAVWSVRGPQPDHQPLIRQALGADLRSRLHFDRADSLPEVPLILATGCCLIHFYARLRAGAEGRNAVDESDVREAISITDKICLRHGNILRSLPAGRAVLGALARLPNVHDHLLAACLPEPVHPTKEGATPA